MTQGRKFRSSIAAKLPFNAVFNFQPIKGNLENWNLKIWPQQLPWNFQRVRSNIKRKDWSRNLDKRLRRMLQKNQPKMQPWNNPELDEKQEGRGVRTRKERGIIASIGYKRQIKLEKPGKLRSSQNSKQASSYLRRQRTFLGFRLFPDLSAVVESFAGETDDLSFEGMG